MPVLRRPAVAPTLVLLATFFLAAQPAEGRGKAAAGKCGRASPTLLDLDRNAFDQDLEGGWRALDRRGCTGRAADLIAQYRRRHGDETAMLSWHEGQLRASLGQRRRALRLFEKSRHPEPDRFGWNSYVDATIAFLRGDRNRLVAARRALAALPKPDDFHPTDGSGRPIALDWPPNLAAVDALVACFGKSYAEAYGAAACRAAPRPRASAPRP